MPEPKPTPVLDSDGKPRKDPPLKDPDGDPKADPKKDQVADSPWGKDLQAIRDEQQAQNMRVMGMLSELAKNAKPAAAAEIDPDKLTDEQKTQLWEMAQQTPGVMPKLIEKEAENAVESRMSAMEKRLMGAIEDKEQLRDLMSHLGPYAEQLKDANNEIMRSTPRMKQMLDKIIDPKFRGTSQHDVLAFMLAAATNPSAVAKSESQRRKAEADQHAAQADRMLAASGIGKARPQSKEPRITQRDLDTAEELGIDMTDPEKRKEFLDAKKTEKLIGIKLVGFDDDDEEE